MPDKKKSKAKAQGPIREAPPVVDLDIETESPEDETPAPKVELFKYKGEPYYMAEPDGAMMLRVLKKAKDSNMLAAVGEMLEELIGAENYDVLINIPGITDKEVEGVVNRVMYYSMDKLDTVLGNS
jgi:hypothetical protein